jgi:branched-chain amino acid transport system permease protein
MRTAIVSGAVAALVALGLFLGAGDDLGPNSFIIIGLSQGCVYGLVALGLVLVYKGARVFNFAQGEFGTVAAFITFLFVEQWKVGIPYWVAAIIAVIATVIIGLGMERIIVRPLLNAPRVNLLVATIAFALLCIAVELLLFLPEPKTLPPMVTSLPGIGDGFELANFILEPQRLIIFGVLVALAAILGYFFSKTDLGLAVLATSQDAFATRVVGIGVERMSRFIWGSAAFLGAVAGILFVPLNPLVPGIMTTQVLIAAFTGAVIGGMTSLPGAFVGGIIVGLLQSISNWASGSQKFLIGEGDNARLIQDFLPGAPDVVMLVVLLLVLLIRPAGLLGKET